MPRQVDHEQRRFEIATAVWYVMATRGPAAVTMRTVAQEAGVSVGRIQHYFPTKDAMLEHGLSALLAAAVAEHERTSGDVDARTELIALLTHAIPVAEHTRIGTAVWYSYLALGVDRPRIAAMLQETLVTGEVRAADLVAQISGADPAAAAGTARELLSLADGLAQRVLVGAVPATEAVDAVLARIEAVAP